MPTQTKHTQGQLTEISIAGYTAGRDYQNLNQESKSAMLANYELGMQSSDPSITAYWHGFKLGSGLDVQPTHWNGPIVCNHKSHHTDLVMESHGFSSVVGTLSGPNNEANATRLALCWNLMPEVEQLLPHLIHIAERYAPGGKELGGPYSEEMIAKARAILAKVKGV